VQSRLALQVVQARGRGKLILVAGFRVPTSHKLAHCGLALLKKMQWLKPLTPGVKEGDLPRVDVIDTAAQGGHISETCCGLGHFRQNPISPISPNHGSCCVS